MTYQETCDYLFRQTPSFEKTGKTGFKEGLATSLALDAHFGHPHRQFRSIHVAGTNGKGSVSHTLAAQLQAAGYKVGLYTSPHLVDFRERIRVNGQPIPEQYVTNFVEQFLQWNRPSPLTPHPSPLTPHPSPLTPHLSPLTPHLSPLTPSFFELTTAMAFKYFADEQVDLAVVEVGLGGRLDCTNIITPVLSVITNISLDHTDMLGDTLSKIAAEKAGIIKPGVPVVIGEANDETRHVFMQKAAQCHAPIIFADQEPEVVSATPNDHGGMHYVTRHHGTFHGELGGLYQARNTNTALAALQQLVEQGVLSRILTEPFAHVCQSTGLMGRWQQLQARPTVICDTGHNPGGWHYLSQQLNAVVCQHMHIVFGMVSDKDYATVMATLPRHATYYFAQASTKRAIDASQLLTTGQQLGLSGTAYPSVAEAFRAALSQAGPDDFIFVGGSTYVVADYLKSPQL